MGGFAVVILAAGGSRRFGSPKQLALFRGKPLLTWACEAATGCGAREVVSVVPPAPVFANLGLPEGICWVVNEQWTEGLASSIRLGVTRVLGSVEQVVITLGDQPLVTAKHLADLALWATQEVPICATEYGKGRAGVPAAFHRSCFEALMGLTGDDGAKQLIRSAGKIKTLPFSGVLDVDTPEDLLAAEHGFSSLQGG